MHARCMADLITKGKARKIGKGTYLVPGDTRDPETGYYRNDGEWFSGTYRTPRAEEEHAKQVIAEYEARRAAAKGAE